MFSSPHLLIYTGSTMCAMVYYSPILRTAPSHPRRWVIPELGQGMLSTMKRHALRYARAAGLPGTLTPRTVFQDGSQRDRQAFYDASLARNRTGYEARVAFMEQLNREAAGQHGGDAGDRLRLTEIPRDKGLILSRPDSFPVLDEAIAEARD